jgi:TPR repeat protein
MQGKGVRRDVTEALKWLRRAAAQWDADAQHALGIAYSLGQGVVKSQEQALLWHTRAAEQGHRGANKALEVLTGVPLFPLSKKAAPQKQSGPTTTTKGPTTTTKGSSRTTSNSPPRCDCGEGAWWSFLGKFLLSLEDAVGIQDVV